MESILFVNYRIYQNIGLLIWIDVNNNSNTKVVHANKIEWYLVTTLSWNSHWPPQVCQTSTYDDF